MREELGDAVRQLGGVEQPSQPACLGPDTDPLLHGELAVVVAAGERGGGAVSHEPAC